MIKLADLSHRLDTVWEVVFDDGTTRELKYRLCNCFDQYKKRYLVRWLEDLIEKENITSKPVEIREKMKVVRTRCKI